MDGNEQNIEDGAFLSADDFQALIEDQQAVCLAVEDGEGNETVKPIDLEADDDEEWADWTVDLSLGKEVFLSSDEKIRRLEDHESLVIDPGEFALLTTEEIVNMPADKVAFISLKFSHARKGLINISGFHVDPNFTGRLIFSVYNASPSPTILRQGIPVFMIVFANLTRRVAGNRDDAEFDEISNLKPEWVEGLQGRTASLENLDNQVTNLQHRVRILGAILIGLVVTLVGFVVGQAFM